MFECMPKSHCLETYAIQQHRVTSSYDMLPAFSLMNIL